MPRTKPTTVRVTRRHCRAAVAGDCYRCAVALAIQEATGDTRASVFDDDGLVRLGVWDQSIVAPAEVRLFVWNLDDLPRTRGGRPKLPQRLEGDLEPPTFMLPPDDSPDWEGCCCYCEKYFAPADLDDEGSCKECRK